MNILLASDKGATLLPLINKVAKKNQNFDYADNLLKLMDNITERPNLDQYDKLVIIMSSFANWDEIQQRALLQRYIDWSLTLPVNKEVIFLDGDGKYYADITSQISGKQNIKYVQGKFKATDLPDIIMGNAGILIGNATPPPTVATQQQIKKPFSLFGSKKPKVETVSAPRMTPPPVVPVPVVGQEYNPVPQQQVQEVAPLYVPAPQNEYVPQDDKPLFTDLDVAPQPVAKTKADDFVFNFPDDVKEDIKPQAPIVQQVPVDDTPLFNDNFSQDSYNAGAPPQSVQEIPLASWVCACGANNSRKFCDICGKPQYVQQEPLQQAPQPQPIPMPVPLPIEPVQQAPLPVTPQQKPQIPHAREKNKGNVQSVPVDNVQPIPINNVQPVPMNNVQPMPMNNGVIDVKRSKTVLVTGDRRSGISSVVSNMAYVASQSGLRVLVVDLDYKRRGQSINFSVAHDEDDAKYLTSLLNALKSPFDLEACTISYEQGIDYVGTSLYVTDVDILIEATTAERLQRLLSTAINKYDLVLVDCPFEDMKTWPVLISLASTIVHVMMNDINSLYNNINLLCEDSFDDISDFQMYIPKMGLVLNNTKPTTIDRTNVTASTLRKVLCHLTGDDSYEDYAVFGEIPEFQDMNTILNNSSQPVLSGYANYYKAVLMAIVNA